MQTRALAACLALGATTAVSGCAAPLMMAPSLLVGGGSYVGIKAYTKHEMSKSERQAASAAAIGGDLNLRMIKVSKAETEGDNVRWTAETAIGRYKCSQKVGRVRANCVKEGAAKPATARARR